jgi:hypothetical protein
MRSIYATEDSQFQLRFFADIAANLRDRTGVGHLGAVDILSAPATPITARPGRRDMGGTARAFSSGAGDPSARAHAERHGRPTGSSGDWHRTHVGGHGQHGPSADHPDRIAAATRQANGSMIPIDNNYPPGYIDLNRIAVTPGTRLGQFGVQAVAHPSAPTIPVFTHIFDAQRSQLSTQEWDGHAAYSAQALSPAHLEAANLRRQAEPHLFPSIDQVMADVQTMTSRASPYTPVSGSGGSASSHGGASSSSFPAFAPSVPRRSHDSRHGMSPGSGSPSAASAVSALSAMRSSRPSPMPPFASSVPPPPAMSPSRASPMGGAASSSSGSGLSAMRGGASSSSGPAHGGPSGFVSLSSVPSRHHSNGSQ